MNNDLIGMEYQLNPNKHFTYMVCQDGTVYSAHNNDINNKKALKVPKKKEKNPEEEEE